MATTIRKGHIAFRLVSFPVRLQAAARSQAVSFNQLHQCNHSRVKQVLYCQARISRFRGASWSRDSSMRRTAT
jgi:DNA end-binding protein Ku